MSVLIVCSKWFWEPITTSFSLQRVCTHCKNYCWTCDMHVAQHLPWMSVFIVLYKFWILRANFLFSLWRVCTYCKDYWTCDTHAVVYWVGSTNICWNIIVPIGKVSPQSCTCKLWLHVDGGDMAMLYSGLVLLLDMLKNRSSARGLKSPTSFPICEENRSLGINIIIDKCDKCMHACIP